MAVSRDLYSNISVVSCITPDADRTASVNGSSVDTRGFESLAFAFHYGTITDGTFTPSLEESDDDSAWTAVAAADLQGTFTAGTSSADETVVRVGYTGDKRYVRPVVTASGSPATGGEFSAVGILGCPHGAPVA